MMRIGLNSKIIALASCTAFTLLAFQNCSKTSFSGVSYDSLKSSSLASYVTQEETPIHVDLQGDGATLSSVTSVPSSYSVVKQPSHGNLLFSSDAKFTYTPNENFFGEDGFQFAEVQEGSKEAITRSVSIAVNPIDDLPVIKTDFLSFAINSVKNEVYLEISDVDDNVIYPDFSEDRKVTTLATGAGGLLERIGNKIYYTPAPSFRGVDPVDFWAHTASGGKAKKTIAINIGNPFREFQPALAIRGAACASCHANVRSQFVTDFGFGSNYFAGQNGGNLRFGRGHMYGDHDSSWSKAKISAPIIVPKTNAVAMATATPITLADYIRGVEAGKTVPAQVVEKDKVYIGAPTVAQLEAQFQVAANVNSKFIVNGSSSPALVGVVWDAAGYWKNSTELTCDGDLFLRGTVYLDKPVIRTINGCRIHATGPIFLQDSPTYVNLGPTTAANNTNLQLVSARMILAGVGLSHCETSAGQWYFDNGHANPLAMRTRDIWTIRSHVTRSVSDPIAEGGFILGEANKLSGYKDASCYSTGREVHLERILLNAPTIQSRMSGNVSGVVITEVALFSLSKFSYEFDEVFKRVPILPLLEPGQFLDVK